MIRERVRNGAPGVPILIGLLLAMVATAWMFFAGAAPGADHRFAVLAVVLGVVELFLMSAFFVVAPNQAAVLQLFGDYVGTAKSPGLHWVNPFVRRKKISLRVRNFESSKSKVNDADGNPIEIAAVLVWRVVETAEASFEVDDYENYVKVQTEAALRNAATSYPYDAYDEGIVSLRGSTATVADHLKDEVQRRLEKAGVEVLEARISHLAYAPEIAAAMLQRQQAGAIVAARSLIVQGAVGMVEHALEMLSEKRVVQLDEERKAAMVSNLLVVLCGDKAAHPIVNAGSIHQ
jgi:hypothetical protein